MSYRKGAQAERRLIEILRKKGFACVRVAGSGRARFEQPDIVASNSHRIFSIECKHINDDCIYIPKQEVRALMRFSKRFGAEPVIAVRFKRTWQFWLLDDIVRTQNKNHSFRKGEGRDAI